MRAWLGPIVVAAGCNFSPATMGQDGGLRDDGQNDSRADAPPVDSAPPCTSYSSVFDTCALNRTGDSDIAISGTALYDTDEHTLSIDGGPPQHPKQVVVTTPAGPVDVLVARSFSLPSGAALRAKGSIPLGIAATGDVTIGGTIDVSNGGAGARSASLCLTSSGGNGTANSNGASGGGGAAFRGQGGAGGMGDAEALRSGGGSAGVAPANRPAGPRGGCNGGNGGNGIAAGGAGGAGGGAFFVATPGTIVISGTVDAGGGGGSGGNTQYGGGGGGGSGGMILLECKIFELRGMLVANGGGGGEGAGALNSGMAGANGLKSALRAPGGDGFSLFGGKGGSGGAQTILDGGPSTEQPFGGGGGGGGGTGHIAAGCGSVTNTGTSSPILAPWP